MKVTAEERTGAPCLFCGVYQSFIDKHICCGMKGKEHDLTPGLLTVVRNPPRGPIQA